MLRKEVVLSNGGFIIRNNNSEINSNLKSVRFNAGFITSALASMVNDKPNYDEVKNDVLKIKIVNNNSSINLVDFIISKSVKNNLQLINDYFGKINKKVNSYSFIIKEFKIMHLSKCGVLIKNNEVEQFRIMNINDTHIQQFDRDFIGYFLYINFLGKMKFFYDKKEIDEEINFIFNKIPILFLKSENAFKNAGNKNITISMINKFSGQKNIDVIFV